jgi:hypothetical protein
MFWQGPFYTQFFASQLSRYRFSIIKCLCVTFLSLFAFRLSYTRFSLFSFIRPCFSLKSGPCSGKQTPWPLVRKRTIPTERSPLVDEI